MKTWNNIHTHGLKITTISEGGQAGTLGNSRLHNDTVAYTYHIGFTSHLYNM